MPVADGVRGAYGERAAPNIPWCTYRSIKYLDATLTFYHLLASIREWLHPQHKHRLL